MSDTYGDISDDINDEEQQVHEFLDDTVAALRAATGDMQRIEIAIRTYCQRGRELDMSPMELWDYFAISYPGLPEKAGYSEAQIEETENRFQRVTNELWG